MRCGTIYSKDFDDPKLDILKMKSFKLACDGLDRDSAGCYVSHIIPYRSSTHENVLNFE